MRFVFSTLHHPAPWQLNAPTTPLTWFRFQIFRTLFPSLAGSENKQSLVGRPGSLARNTEPSGSTSFLNTSKLLRPGCSVVFSHRVQTLQHIPIWLHELSQEYGIVCN
nr:Os06g0172901 [Ipomoea batatas]